MKLNKRQIEQIAVLAKKFDTTVEEMTKSFEDLMSTEKLKKLEPKARSTMVVRRLHASYTNKKNKSEFGAKPEAVVFRVEAKEEPSSFKRADGSINYRSSVYVTAQIGNKSVFTVLTLWGDANEINPELVNGKTYTTDLVVSGTALSMNDPQKLEEVEVELPDMADIVTDSYPVVGLENAETNISEDWNDLKLIKGIIAGGWTKPTQNGNMMGFLKLITEETDDMMIVKFSRIYEQVNYWDEGSLVYALGQITGAVYDEETGDIKYDVSSWGNLIIPIEAIEKDVEEPEDEAEEEEFEEDFESDDTEDEDAEDEDTEDWNVEDDDEEEDWGE